MHEGVMAPLSWLVLSGLLVLLCLTAPGHAGTLRDEEISGGPANPFQSGDESRSLVQHYIDSILNKEAAGVGRPEIISWEQEVFFLVRVHDYDHSGFLDGLEMIKLLLDYNAFHRPSVVYQYNEVVSLVDVLLQTQDLNHDGLFSPSELLSPPLLQKQSTQNEVKVQMETQPQPGERTAQDSPVDGQHEPQEALL
ncbi:hypothetical protein WMY93_013571 [Mugilogobius chulae]|uniref:EF-hand domain-containing protein n=1 Tax=Mugilogobius chulae TaxID=88201 RepID=A0AAW0P3Z4_9GOBI